MIVRVIAVHWSAATTGSSRWGADHEGSRDEDQNLIGWLSGLTGAMKYPAWSVTELIIGTALAVGMALTTGSGIDYTFISLATYVGAFRAFPYERDRKRGKYELLIPPVVRYTNRR
jgi:hypothetical protein